MTHDQIRIIDPATIDFPSIVEAARLHLHHEMGCDQHPGCFAAGDLHGLACKVFAQTPYGTEVVRPLLDHAALPVMGVFRSGPDAEDIPLVRQGCLLTYWYASFYLSRDLGFSFGRAMALIADWMLERAAQGSLEDFTWVFHPCRRGPVPPMSPATTT